MMIVICLFERFQRYRLLSLLFQIASPSENAFKIFGSTVLGDKSLK